jgi:tetratricopeptide (TPR) repeat protein
MRFGCFWTTLLFVTLGLIVSTGADEVDDCRQSEPARRIAGCTQIISKGGKGEMTLAIARNNRGVAYIETRKYDSAIADLSEAIRLDPKYAHAYNNRGWAHNEKQNYQQALADLDEAIRLNPKLAYFYNNRGNAHRGKNDFDRAIADYGEAIRIDPKFAFPYNNRAWVYIEKRDFDPALADLNEAIRLGSNFARAYNNRGRVYLEKHDYVRALADFDVSIRLDPKQAYVYNNRGNTYRAKGDLGRAIADYDEAIRIDPGYASAYSNRAMSYAHKGDNVRAIADSQKVIELPAPSPADRQRQEVARARIEKLTLPNHAASSPRRVAMVIGNANYVGAGALVNPGNDARAVAASLRRLGFAEVLEFYDLDLAGMTRALRDFGDRAAVAEWAVVFFSGHGIEMNGTNYLIPIDARMARDTHVVDEALSLDRVQAKVDAASKFGLVILDACRNNPFLARMARTGATRSLGRGLASIEPEGNVLVAYAARHGTVAEDGSGQHSPFTEALLAHIEEPNLEVNILFRKVRDAVRIKTQRRQDPFIYGSLGSEPLYFKTAPAR